MVKNALFNILGDIRDLLFLDLFAGTGQIGLEAERRGARVIYVEKDPRRVKEIKERAKGKVIRGDAIRVLDKLGEKPDIIFADPPYNFKSYDLLIKRAMKSLKPGGVLIVEHTKRRSLGAEEERVYGDTVLSFWRKQG